MDKIKAKKLWGEIIKAGLGKFTKSEVLIEMMKNTLKGSKDSYVKKNFPKFIKELTENNHWKMKEFFKSDYIASKGVNAWLGIAEVTK